LRVGREEEKERGGREKGGRREEKRREEKRSLRAEEGWGVGEEKRREERERRSKGRILTMGSWTAKSG
jgi:hypothetical protein